MTNAQRVKNRAFWTTLFFLIISASRFAIIHTFEFHQDEVWQVWSAIGTLPQVLSWVPFDWPPLFAIFSWAWTSLVGIHPYPVRVGALLISLLAYAFTFRFTVEMFRDERVAWSTTVVYAALGYSVFLSLFFRGYVLMTLLMPMALWAMGRYFNRATVWRGVVLGILMAGLFYTNLTAVTAFATIGLVSLALYKQRIWRWILPSGVALVVAIPEILDKLSLVERRDASSPLIRDLSPIDAHIQLFTDFLGNAPLIWFVVLCLAVIVIVLYERIPKLPALALIAWVFLMPVLIYLADDILGFFTLRHSWWIMLGMGSLIGYATQYLPQRVTSLGLMGAVIIMFLPIPLENYTELDHPFEDNFSILQDVIQAGDAIVIDPQCGCGNTYDWNYYQRAYFPKTGLHFVTNPDGYQRVWYIRFAGQEDPETFETMLDGRLASTFFGPPQQLFQLFEAPPNTDGIGYDNGLVFHGADIMGAVDSAIPTAHEGETVTVRLWWSTAEILPADYSISLQLVGQENIIVQADSAPQLVTLHPFDESIPPWQTSQWQLETLYVEERQLVIPNPTQSGTYQLNLIVYQSWDGVRIKSEATNDDGIYQMMPFAVMSW